jgi:hypothetical protein
LDIVRASRRQNGRHFWPFSRHNGERLHSFFEGVLDISSRLSVTNGFQLRCIDPGCGPEVGRDPLLASQDVSHPLEKKPAAAC